MFCSNRIWWSPATSRCGSRRSPTRRMPRCTAPSRRPAARRSDGSKAAWVDTVAEHLPAGPWRSLVTELAVEPPRNKLDAVNAQYAGAILAGMALRVAAADERNLKSAMQRAEASGDTEAGCGCRPTWPRWPTTGGRWPTGPGGLGDVADRRAAGPGGGGRSRRRWQRQLDPEEHIQALAACADGKLLAASRFGLWVVEDEQAARLGWELVAKARLTARVLSIIPTQVVDRVRRRHPGAGRRADPGVHPGRPQRADRRRAHQGPAVGGGQPAPGLPGQWGMGGAAPGAGTQRADPAGPARPGRRRRRAGLRRRRRRGRRRSRAASAAV